MKDRRANVLGDDDGGVFMPADIIPLEFKRLGPQRIDDPSYWQWRVNEARAKADQTSDADAKAELTEAIATYEALVKWAQKYCGWPL
jgi:hypothetical protein